MPLTPERSNVQFVLAGRLPVHTPRGVDPFRAPRTKSGLSGFHCFDVIRVCKSARPEEAEEIVPVVYEGERMEIGFNVSYLQDVLNVVDTEQVRISVSDANSSALMEAPGKDDAVYVVMPMRL